MEEKRGINRSLTSYGDPEFSSYLRRAFLASAGYDADDLKRPVIGIADTTSDYTTCHRHMPELIAAVKRGVLEAGGLPMVFPTISLGEILVSPTSMLYRNLLAMETEEMIRANPMDAVVLLGGCDKTVPAQLMAAVSADIPALLLVTGAMHTGHYHNELIGACTDCRRYWSLFRSGDISKKEISSVQSSLCPTGGTCMVMGSASTIACLGEAMGMMLPGGATPLSGTGERLQHAVASGRQAVTLAKRGPKPKDILTKEAFVNALVTLSAIGGSTNAVIHLIAIAQRAGIHLSLEEFHTTAQQVPLLVNCKPAGNFYMEDFHRAGGMPVLLKTLRPLLELNALTVSGKKLGELIKRFPGLPGWQNIIHPLDKPFGNKGSLAVVYGSLAPDGAVIKKAAASPNLLIHKGPAAVFESPEDAAERIDDPGLSITPEHVLVLRNAGPIGAGMPEAGSLPIPKYLAQKGIKDMVRVSDARMSGTAFGTVVLHIAPEAAAGGPLSLVKNGDLIELNIKKRQLNLLVSKQELQSRKKKWRPPQLPHRGWAHLHSRHVQQADRGADLDFLCP